MNWSSFRSVNTKNSYQKALVQCLRLSASFRLEKKVQNGTFEYKKHSEGDILDYFRNLYRQ